MSWLFLCTKPIGQINFKSMEQTLVQRCETKVDADACKKASYVVYTITICLIITYGCVSGICAIMLKQWSQQGEGLSSTELPVQFLTLSLICLISLLQFPLLSPSQLTLGVLVVTVLKIFTRTRKRVTKRAWTVVYNLRQHFCKFDIIKCATKQRK